MKPFHKISLAALVVVTGTLGYGFVLPEAKLARPIYGEAHSLGQGFVRTYAVLSDNGQPNTVGLEIDEAALEGLPPGGAHHAFETTLGLPAGVDLAPFNHVSVDWIPSGHEPPGIYDIPHFDFHFYIMSVDERDQILPTNAEFVTMGERLPDAAYIPQGYILPPGLPPVPRMGAHLVDPTSPELNGERFTKTFLWGAYDGRITFLEPMITREYLLSLKENGAPAANTLLAQPQSVQKAGFYPTHYSVSYHPEREVYTLALEGLQYRDR